MMKMEAQGKGISGLLYRATLLPTRYGLRPERLQARLHQARAEGNPAPLAEVVIDLGRLLKTVLEARTREEIVARVRERKSRKVGIREKLDRIDSHRIKPSLGYRIVGEGCSQVGPGGVAYVVRIENLDHRPAGIPAASCQRLPLGPLRSNHRGSGDRQWSDRAR